MCLEYSSSSAEGASPGSPEPSVLRAGSGEGSVDALPGITKCYKIISRIFFLYTKVLHITSIKPIKILN